MKRYQRIATFEEVVTNWLKSKVQVSLKTVSTENQKKTPKT
jgi:hypothetical protein